MTRRWADYGIDRPDLRFDMKLKDISDLAAQDRVQGLHLDRRQAAASSRALCARAAAK